jgi:hypothetical protein
MCSLFGSRGNPGSLAGSCKFTAQLWDTGSTLFRKMDLRNHNIPETIELWSNNPYTNPILNKAWETFPGFLMWNVWKERNRRIFKGKMLTKAQVWETINTNVKESIHCDPLVYPRPPYGSS